MEKRILAIGGHVIKTAVDGLRKAIERGKVDMLIHNGGSIFHDFQLATTADVRIWESESHSYPLSELMVTPEINRPTAMILWDWLEGKEEAPEGSVTRLCQDYGIPVLLFTGHGCDFWHLFKGSKGWEFLGGRMFYDFERLRDRLEHDFHYVCMGSAVIHPEVFTKAIASVGKKPEFRADVVDFLDMYRPRTRVSQYGKYYKMTHKEYFTKWLKNEL
jgi:hypothetical protein